MIKFLGLPVLASEQGAGVDKLILYVHWLMGVLFVGWLAYFLYVLFRFRRSRHPKADYIGARTHASSWIEVAVAGVEAVLLIGFAVPLWSKVVDDFPPEQNSTVVRVVAEQFAWNALYPGPDGVFGKQDIRNVSASNRWGYDMNDPAAKDDIAPAVNTMTVPVNKPVIVHITSKDVVHSFKVNPLRVTQDAIPGMSIPTWFTPTQEGQYLINCAQLCGNSHYFMKGYLNVVSEAEYQEWLAAQPKPAAGDAASAFE